MHNTGSNTFAAPLGRGGKGVLELRRAARVAVRTGAIDALCRATFEAQAPRTWVDGERVVLEYPRFSIARLLRPTACRAEITLNASLAWSLATAGGLGDSTLELETIDLRAFELKGGASGVRALLPRPRGLVRVRITGGASDVTLLRPAGVPVILGVNGGASRIEFDGERYGAIGGDTRLETPGAGSHHDRYEIEIVGGATRLTVGEGRAIP